MDARMVIFLCCWTVVAHGKHVQVTLEADRTSLRVQLFHTAKLECCYQSSGNVAIESTWITSIQTINGTAYPRLVDLLDNRFTRTVRRHGSIQCHVLDLTEVQLNDTGLYQCLLNHTNLRPPVYTHGTFLQVYRPMQKSLNISERAKNSIITAEAVLLLLCVLIPGAALICKSKRLNKQEKGKNQEEENIYEGLNLEDCNSTYHQIQRSQVQGPYQDVGSMMEDDIQLEKP